MSKTSSASQNDHPPIIKVGCLEVLNGHENLTGTLWEADGTRWVCYFKDEHLAVLSRAWLRTVRVSGEMAPAEGKVKAVNVDSISIVDQQTVADDDAQQTASFWDSTTLEELAKQQGVKPVYDLDEISALWPADDDPDELLAYILNDRARRREIEADTQDN